jgi:iron complex transport system permease protein
MTLERDFGVPKLALAVLAVAILAIASLFIGAYSVSLRTLFSDEPSAHSAMVMVTSRIPRTVAIILAGMSMSVAGMIMMMLARNRFATPSTTGTVESASLGILVVTLIAPGTAMIGKMLFASLFALLGTVLFLAILRQVPMRSPLMVPLIGLMLGGVISSITTFFAYRYDLLQSLSSWTTGDFARVLRGRYELLWIAGLLTVIAFIVADRFTVAGLGEEFTTNLGVNYKLVVAAGVGIVAMVSAIDVVTVGSIPFLSLIVPNLVSMKMGDNLRRSIPWVAVLGAGFVLAADILGRVIRYPFEIPIGTVVGVFGSAGFLVLLLRTSARER